MKPRTLSVPALLCTLTMTWVGVFANACSAETSSRKSSTPALNPEGGYSIVSSSILDTRNLYPSTVLITTAFKERRGTRFHTCSGTVIAPRLILTAGHCVCFRRDATTSEEQGRFVLDTTQCAKSARVTTVFYHPLTEQEGERLSSELNWPADAKSHIGNVRPHPNLKIYYLNETDTRELSSSADLAVITLDQALDRRFGAIPLADNQVRVTEPVISVGYGVTKPDATDGGARRVGTNEVASLEETGGRTFRIAKPLLIPPTFTSGEPLLMRENASYALAGDSGGPCFRENGDALELVGVAKTSYRVPVDYSEYTSTYFYREWIRQEIKRAQKANSLQPAD